MNQITSTLVLTLSLAACTVETGTSIDPTPLAGTVGGQTWTFQAGQTNAFLSEGEPDFFATFYPVAFDECGFSEPSGPHIIVAIPKAPGEYEMDFSRNMTFVADDDNLVTFDGKIVIDEVTTTTVRGGLAGSYDFDNEVSGTFEIAICED
jgi:hypothetical protein